RSAPELLAAPQWPAHHRSDGLLLRHAPRGFLRRRDAVDDRGRLRRCLLRRLRRRERREPRLCPVGLLEPHDGRRHGEQPVLLRRFEGLLLGVPLLLTLFAPFTLAML